MKYQLFNVLPEFGTNTYLIWDEQSGEGMLIDPAAADISMMDKILEMNIRIKYIVNTHGHGDHIAGNAMASDVFKAPVAIHSRDSGMLIDPAKNLSLYWEQNLRLPSADILLSDGDQLELAGETVKIIHTPGHTPGGICLLCDDFLISGDTLFAESIGRTDLPGGDYKTLIRSIKEKLFSLSDKLLVLPGHGDSTTIGTEKTDNPFVGLAARI
ncbi:MAG: MBL fold metallo-hydrolase [Candidatus Cloacimonetes bacterium]|nr:MBL fold metallo-hydrolase [Candidatus Cloacimonadota bacterium]